MDRSERAHSASHGPVMDAPSKLAAEGWKKPESTSRNAEAASSSPESGSTNGEGKRPAKARRRRKRSANPEPHAEGKTPGGPKDREDPGTIRAPGPCPAALGLRSEAASVWLDRGAYEQAEGRYQRWLALSAGGGGSDAAPRPAGPAPSPTGAGRRPGKQPKPPAPDSLSLAPQGARPAAAATTPPTPDEGYQSQRPTPSTPSTPINGLPRLALELLREVWLEKPLYDRAEAAYYQHLHGNNNNCSSSSPKWASSQSLMEEEEEEEEDAAAEAESQAAPQGKAELFHSLHPIQEEEEPAEEQEANATAATAGIRYALHPDSERVWLDKWRYDAAESRLHCRCLVTPAKGARRPGRKAPPVTSGPCPPRVTSSSGPCPRDNAAMSSMDFLAQDKVWFEKPRYDEAERRFYERQSGPSEPEAQDAGANSILQDIARARENIQKSLAGMKSALCVRGSGQPALTQPPHPTAAAGAEDPSELVSHMKTLELENQSLHKVVEDLRSALSRLEGRVSVLEKRPALAAAAPPCTNGTAPKHQKSAAPGDDDDDDDDFDLFGSDEDDAEAESIKEQRLKEYAAKKAKKPALIAKSSILLDVKPWDDETDMAKLEECVRSVQADGLLWGTSKLMPVGYGIRKLQIACVVEDDKVGTDLLEEEITMFEDYVQSVDIAAFNKI